MTAVDKPPGAPAQSGPIAVYGATGFTGGLIARELKRAGAEFLIAGRDRGKLEALSAELGGVPAAAVSLDDQAGLREMLEPCSVVVACAGPFSLHGEPVVAAAVETGTHYLDTTGEQGFMRMVSIAMAIAPLRMTPRLSPGWDSTICPAT